MLIACLVDQEFDDAQLRVTYDRMLAAGYEVVLISREVGEELVGAKKQEKVRVDRRIEDARPDDYAALLIPGGKSAERLRAERPFAAFIEAFKKAKKPIADLGAKEPAAPEEFCREFLATTGPTGG